MTDQHLHVFRCISWCTATTIRSTPNPQQRKTDASHFYLYYPSQCSKMRVPFGNSMVTVFFCFLGNYLPSDSVDRAPLTLYLYQTNLGGWTSMCTDHPDSLYQVSAEYLFHCSDALEKSCAKLETWRKSHVTMGSLEVQGHRS